MQFPSLFRTPGSSWDRGLAVRRGRGGREARCGRREGEDYPADQHQEGDGGRELRIGRTRRPRARDAARCAEQRAEAADLRRQPEDRRLDGEGQKRAARRSRRSGCGSARRCRRRARRAARRRQGCATARRRGRRRQGSVSPRPDRISVPTTMIATVTIEREHVPATAYESALAASSRTPVGRGEDGAGDRPVAPLAGHAHHAEQQDEEAREVVGEQLAGASFRAAVAERRREDDHEQRERERRGRRARRRSAWCGA